MLHLLLQTHRRARSQTLLSTLRHLGAAGLFGLAIIDSSPVPTFAGPDILTAILAATHKPLWYEYAASATAGSVLGAYLTFRVARRAGSAYLDKKFKKGKLAKFLKLFRKWGAGTLVASCAIPLPSPTSMFFAAAGASDFPQRRFLTLVTMARGFRYLAIAFVAGRYGRHVLRVLRHPLNYWGWMIVFVGITAVLLVLGIVISHRLDSAPAREPVSARAGN